MTKNKSRLLAMLLAGLLWGGMAKAQQVANSSGGIATGSGGTIAYSVGEIVYATNTGTNGSMAPAIQQPYEIMVVTGIENKISLKMHVYPNPATDYLTLTIDENEFSTLNYELYDIQGNSIKNKNISGASETINMESFPSATYYLKVMNNNKEIKTFKIIKN